MRVATGNRREAGLKKIINIGLTVGEKRGDLPIARLPFSTDNLREIEHLLWISLIWQLYGFGRLCTTFFFLKNLWLSKLLTIQAYFPS